MKLHENGNTRALATTPSRQVRGRRRFGEEGVTVDASHLSPAFRPSRAWPRVSHWPPRLSLSGYGEVGR
jgi:hypothetical protein